MKDTYLILGMIYLSFMAPLQSSDGTMEKFNNYINQSISDANIAGITPAEFIFKGKCEESPP